MSIPEINEHQLWIMQHCPYHFQALMADPAYDKPEDYVAIRGNEQDVDHLIELGLLRDVSETFRSMLDKMWEISKRRYRQLEFTDVGFHLLRESCKDTKN